MNQQNYREQMFKGLLQVIEDTGRNDKRYDETQKPRDILEMLELVLATSILATSVDRETIRESCEESYFNIRRMALTLYEDDLKKEMMQFNTPEGGGVPVKNKSKESLRPGNA